MSTRKSSNPLVVVVVVDGAWGAGECVLSLVTVASISEWDLLKLFNE